MSTKVPLKLVTIVTEGLLKDEMGSLLEKMGATGFTITRCEGGGSDGVRAQDWEGPNQRFECIVSEEMADAILDEVGRVYFKDYAVIAWLTDVAVMRGEKFSDD
ncbi:MAG: transcriptional regulator [Verrucomicrobiota bacterium]